jgi:hypothetical protein
LITRLISVCGVFLLATTSAAADSGRARDREGQMTQPSPAAQEKARRERAGKPTIDLRNGTAEELAAAIRQILEEMERKERPTIRVPAPPAKK